MVYEVLTVVLSAAILAVGIGALIYAKRSAKASEKLLRLSKDAVKVALAYGEQEGRPTFQLSLSNTRPEPITLDHAGLKFVGNKYDEEMELIGCDSGYASNYASLPFTLKGGETRLFVYDAVKVAAHLCNDHNFRISGHSSPWRVVGYASSDYARKGEQFRSETLTYPPPK